MSYSYNWTEAASNEWDGIGEVLRENRLRCLDLPTSEAVCTFAELRPQVREVLVEEMQSHLTQDREGYQDGPDEE